MSFDAKIISMFLVPAVGAYSVAAGLIYNTGQRPLLDLKALAVTGVMAFACALAKDVIPRSLKEILVFWRLKDRIPGHRAFSLDSDERYNLKPITNLDELRVLPAPEQQRVFYEVYKRHRADQVVANYSFRYCAWRDVAAVYFVLGLVTIPVAYFTLSSLQLPFNLKQAAVLSAFAFIGYLLTASAARQSANALVGQVLSCESAEQPHAIEY